MFLFPLLPSLNALHLNKLLCVSLSVVLFLLSSVSSFILMHSPSMNVCVRVLPLSLGLRDLYLIVERPSAMDEKTPPPPPTTSHTHTAVIVIREMDEKS